MSLFYDFNASSVVERVKMKWPCKAYTIPAGTPMSREGIANDGNAIGILANTERLKFGPCNFAIITAGFVDRTKAEASFGEAYSDEAIAAMAGIKFISPEAPEIGGGGDNIIFDVLLSGDRENPTFITTGVEIAEAVFAGKLPVARFVEGHYMDKAARFYYRGMNYEDGEIFYFYDPNNDRTIGCWW